MPDQVRLHDPQPHLREVGLFGPHSPANSDSPLSLVVRKEEHQKLLGISSVDSPGRSSGFSDGSYESSPNRSPIQQGGSGYDSREINDEEEKPLSLVIHKDINGYVSHFQDSSKSSKTPGPKKKSVFWAEKNRASVQQRDYTKYSEEDSGNEDPEEPALVISEPGPVEEEEENQQGVHDLSLSCKRSSSNPLPPKNNISCQKLVSENRISDEEGLKSKGIKIKDFAKFPNACNSCDGPNDKTEDQNVVEEVEVDNLSDASSECPASLSSVDTWSSSMVEGKPFTAGTDLVIRRISRSSNGESVYQCDFCDKLFSNKYHLQSHLVTHTGERAFTCRVCNKTFGRKSTLRAHMTTHTKVSNFMCQVCEKACNDNNSLEEHMRMHTGEKPFVCTICQKAYARKSHLNVHYRVHTGERPFVCDFCNKDFTEKRFLNDHLQTAHNGMEGPLKCPNCAREFAYKTSLKQHLKKQMCERNMKRAHGNINSGTVAKQFQCPFCDKSYSWKQTLKQHVSMYHRNKVHTDEFWRYELSKNRRTIVDDKANEDLWKKQLGKHAEETAKLKLEAAAAAAAGKQTNTESGTNKLDGKESSNDGSSRWLEQISRNSTTESSVNTRDDIIDPNDKDNPEVTTEIKLLALQSLQNSLHFMSMGISGQAQLAAMNNLQRIASLQKNISGDNTPGKDIKLEVGTHQGESYLSLLTQIAKKESEERGNNNNETSDKNNNQPPHLSHGENGDLPALPTKEESSVKRTQMWLQQVNKYRHKAPKEELDANHEQLWEQQISRVKRNPVRSPLEPVEIVIEDDGSDVPSPKPMRNKSQSTERSLPLPIAVHTNMHMNNNNNNVVLHNNNNVVVNNNNVVISNNNNNVVINNNNNTDNITVFQTKLVLTTTSHPGQTLIAGQPPQSVCLGQPTVFLQPASTAAFQTFNVSPQPGQHSGPKDKNNHPFKTPMTETNSHRPSPAVTPILTNEQRQEIPPTAQTEDASMLKSLLLDRMKRKRSSSIESLDPNSKKSSSSQSSAPINIPDQPQDILRKRLLGWVDNPTPQPTTVRKSAQQETGATQDPNQQQTKSNQPGAVFSIELNDDEDRQETKEEGTKNKHSEHPPETDRKENKTLNYTTTSVLKHLLHRYTGMNQ